MEIGAVWSTADEEREFNGQETGYAVLLIFGFAAVCVALIALPAMAGQVHNVYAPTN